MQNIKNLKIGILGGGQLGKMMLQAVLDWDLDISILDPDPQAPCASMSNQFYCGSLTNYNSVLEFGKPLDLITIEIENVNIAALYELEKMGKKVHPQPHIIELIQNKQTQKNFFALHNIATAPFVTAQNKTQLKPFANMLPAFCKLATGGYDGKGVQLINTAQDLENTFDAPVVLERKINYKKEIAVIVARNPAGDCAAFPSIEMVFDPQLHLVDYLIAPAQINPQLESLAQNLAQNLAQLLGIVGLLAIECFIDEQDNIIVNEIAPRPHNSGHHTIEANATSQYLQHWLAILGLPLGSTQVRHQAAMLNLVGQPNQQGLPHYTNLNSIIALPNTYLHLYGKKTTKPGRKMGHITILNNDTPELMASIKHIKNNFKVTSTPI